MAVPDETNILTTLKILIIGESSVGKSRFECLKFLELFSINNHYISVARVA